MDTLDPAGGGTPEAATAVVGLALVAVGLALAPLCAFAVDRISPGRRVFFARWGFSHVGGVVLVFFGATLVFSPLARALVEVGHTSVFAGLCATVLVFGTVSACIAWLAQRLDPDGAASLGFRGTGQVRAGAAGLVAYVMMAPGLLGLALFWPWAMTWLELEYEPQAVAVGMLELSGSELVLMVPVAVLVIPFLEELVFRGFLQPLLVQNLGDRGGVAATAMVFGVLHGPSASLPIFGLALILGGVMLKTQRLLGPFLIHAVHNALMLVLLFGSSEARDLLGQDGQALVPGVLT